MKTLQFKKPEYADLWDACLHFLYNKDSYVKEVSDLFSSIGINWHSRILDTCAGTGFISIYLRQKGFNVDCMDLMPDEIRVFKRNASKLGVSSRIRQLSWKQIPKSIEQGIYDFLFCRGNHSSMQMGDGITTQWRVPGLSFCLCRAYSSVSAKQPQPVAGSGLWSEPLERTLPKN